MAWDSFSIRAKVGSLEPVLVRVLFPAVFVQVLVQVLVEFLVLFRHNAAGDFDCTIKRRGAVFSWLRPHGLLTRRLRDWHSGVPAPINEKGRVLVALEPNPESPDTAVHRHDQPSPHGSKRLDVGCAKRPRAPDPFPTIEHVPPLKGHFALKRAVKEVVSREDDDKARKEREPHCDAPPISCRREAVGSHHRSEPEKEEKHVVPRQPNVAQLCRKPHPLRGHAVRGDAFVA